MRTRVVPPAELTAQTSEALRGAKPRPSMTASALYRAEFWQIGLWLARWLPTVWSSGFARALALTYWRLHPTRRSVVVENLVPVLQGDREAARQRCRDLFENFALKLLDLWRYENGLPIADLFGAVTGWDDFLAARSRSRGVLFVTMHLGNWEFGAPLLIERGVSIQVLTLAEPHAKLTALRQAARARWGVQTIAIGEHPFAAVEVIRRLEANDCAAILLDRPPAATAVTVELFGRPFAASIAAAELARASGCALLPVCVPRTAQGYAAQVLPEIPYHGAALRDRQARVELTQKILRAFEPVIRQYPDQWYHFVPIWPK